MNAEFLVKVFKCDPIKVQNILAQCLILNGLVGQVALASITDPTDISGCVLWLDPGTIMASDGDPVGSWTDQSGNGNDASSSGTDRPIYRDGSDFYHGQPTIEFTDVAHRLEVAADASLANQKVTYAIVCRMEDLVANNDPSWLINKVNTQASTVGIRAADADITQEGKYEAFYRLNGSESTVRKLESRGPLRQSWIIVVFTYDGSTGSLYINDDLSDSQSNTGNLDTDNNGILVIGNHDTLDLAFRGHIGDVVVYDRAINSTERADLVDFLRAKYPNSEYVKTTTILSAGNRHARIRSASETGLSDNQMLVVTMAGAVNHYTSPTNDPHNWTLQNSSVISNSSYRTLDFVVVNGTWYIYVDKASGNGQIELWTGSSVTGLSQHGSSPVLSGSAGDYPRVPAVIEESGSWTMLVDVRTDAITGNEGHIDRYTSNDGVSWTKDTTNSPVLIPTGEGFEATDVGHPFIYKIGSGNYLVAYCGFNGDHPLATSFWPHEIGLLTSTDLISFTRSNKNPAFSTSDGSSDHDVTMVANPCLFHDGTNLTLYYTGRKVNNDHQLGYATGN